MQNFSPIRAAVVMVGIGTGLVALLGRVAYLQTYGREGTIRRAERQQHQNETLFARRGSIFDADGMLMAGSVQTMSLFVDPKFMQDQFQEEGRSLVDMDKALEKLAKLIDKDPFELAQLLSDRYESRYLKVAERLSEQVCKEIERMKLPGVGLTPTNERYYPMGSLAAHVLGGVGGEGVGLDGLEMKFEKVLAGKDGYKRTLKDARRRPIAVAADDYLPPQNGQHLVLTIDSSIQMIAEQELAATCKEFGAKRGEVVVMDPRTGHVLALGNYPTFNPQNIGDSLPEVRRNNVLVSPYEPGSTIKPFIVGPAMMMGVTRPDQVWPVSGSYKSSLRSKLVTDIHHYGPLSTWDVLVKSSNIGMTMIGEKLGKSHLRTALGSWNFGKPTGIELPGEDGGLLKPMNKWADADVVSAVQGYSVMVTPLQLARGMCAYSNGGKLVKPRVVEGIVNPDGSIAERTPEVPLSEWPQVVDPKSALQMRRILADVPVRGTATRAREFCKDWNIFGKTGTAHISDGKAGYSDQKYTSSFVGGAPFEDPRLVIAFIVHEVEKKGKNYYGGTVSAPGAAKIFARSLAYLRTPASPELSPPPPQIANVLVNYNAKLYQNRLVTAKTE